MCDGCPLGHDSWVTLCDYSPGGHHFVTASGDKTVQVWDSPGKGLFALTGYGSVVSSARYSLDGKQTVTVGSGGTVQIYTT